MKSLKSGSSSVLEETCSHGIGLLETDATAAVWGEYRHGVYELVGHGKPKDGCGRYSHTIGCLNVAGHEGARFDKRGGGLVDHTGEIYVKKVRFHCGRPSCPVCYPDWASREANKIEYRLEEARKVLAKTNKTAQVEHIVVSVSPSMYGISELLRKKVDAGMKARGIVGYALVFHGFRYSNAEESFRTGRPYGWRFSPHWHALGFILGGYGCRGCKKNCKVARCNGFEARTRKVTEADGLIVKIAVDKYGEKSVRKSVYWTARYELGHATIRTGAKRAVAVTWGGCCSYRKLKILPMVKIHCKCPLCAEDLAKIWYIGAWSKERESDWCKFVQDGVEVAGLLPERFSGSYG